MSTCLIVSKKPPITIAMKHMEPLQIGRIIDPGQINDGTIVMRTASISKFEVISVSKWKKNNCWTDDNLRLKVQILPNAAVQFTLNK